MLGLFIVLFGLSIPLIMTIVDIVLVYKQWKQDKEKGDE